METRMACFWGCLGDRKKEEPDLVRFQALRGSVATAVKMSKVTNQVQRKKNKTEQLDKLLD